MTPPNPTQETIKRLRELRIWLRDRGFTDSDTTPDRERTAQRCAALDHAIERLTALEGEGERGKVLPRDPSYVGEPFLPVWMSLGEAEHCLDVLRELAGNHEIEWPERVFDLFESAVEREQRRSFGQMKQERERVPACDCVDPTDPGAGCPVHGAPAVVEWIQRSERSPDNLPERCPTCGSDDPAKVNCSECGNGQPLGGLHDCSDSFHLLARIQDEKDAGIRCPTCSATHPAARTTFTAEEGGPWSCPDPFHNLPEQGREWTLTVPTHVNRYGPIPTHLVDGPRPEPEERIRVREVPEQKGEKQ